MVRYNSRVTALGAGGDPSALIAQLEAMAADFERQTGEPETEIRSKIALLKSVLAARPTVVAQSRSRMDAVLRAAEAGGSTASEAVAFSEQVALLRGMEANMDSVAQTLQGDPEAAAIVANVLTAGR